MAKSIFTKEAAKYARDCLERLMQAMPPELQDASRNDANVVLRFITVAEDAAPREDD